MILSMVDAPDAIFPNVSGKSGKVIHKSLTASYRNDFLVIPDQILVESIPPKE